MTPENFRDYKPEIGRYVEADPIGIDNGRNHLFVYVGNNPVNWVDPEGESGAIVGGAFAVLVGGIMCHCTLKCEEQCTDLYPEVPNDPIRDQRNRIKRNRCFWDCMQYCASFGAFGTDPLSGAASAAGEALACDECE